MLHIVNKSPFEKNALESCLRLASEGDHVLLIEDAVVSAVANNRFEKLIQNAQAHLTFYVLGPDLTARGLGNKSLVSNVSVIDYGEFVDLTEAHHPVQSWL